MTIAQHFYPEIGAGGSTRCDGTVEFYARIASLIEPSMVIVDLGAGRGALYEATKIASKRALFSFKGRVSKVIGIDIDDAVLQNRTLDEAIVYDGRRLPLADNSVDLLFSDNTIEHIDDPVGFCSEVDRVLRPGGWFCARTPHLYSLLVLAASIIPNDRHARLLNAVQPGRQQQDVFPTRYRLNTMAALRRHFPERRWENFSYTNSPDPGYHFNNKIMYRLLLIYQYLKQPFLGGEVLLAFTRKRSDAAAV